MHQQLGLQQLCNTRPVTSLSCESHYNVKITKHTYHFVSSEQRMTRALWLSVGASGKEITSVSLGTQS